MTWIPEARRNASNRAVEFVQNGNVVGLGSGRTVALAIETLGKRKKDGLNFTVVPTSYQSELLAVNAGLRIGNLSEYPTLDVTLDGADQVERKSLDLIKGGGAALTREKIVAFSSRMLIIIVDEEKLVDRLGANHPVPIEVIPFAHRPVSLEIQKRGGQPSLRESEGKVGPVITDNGNFILDVIFQKHVDLKKIHPTLKLIPGVIETGLFIDMADFVIVGKRDGKVEELKR